MSYADEITGDPVACRRAYEERLESGEVLDTECQWFPPALECTIGPGSGSQPLLELPTSSSGRLVRGAERCADAGRDQARPPSPGVSRREGLVRAAPVPLVGVRQNDAVTESSDRPLNDAERAVLDLLLEGSFDGVEELRVQAATAFVSGRCGCGCPTVYVTVAPDTPPAPIASRLVPVAARVSPLTDEPPGEIILFLDDGRLTSMEYVFYSDQPPTHWPATERLSIVFLPRS